MTTRLRRGDEEALAVYRASLRERATFSLDLQGSTLEERAEDPLDTSHTEDEWAPLTATPKVQWQELRHSDAVTQLRTLLRKHENQELPFSSSPGSSPQRDHGSGFRESDVSVPTVDELVPFIHRQAEYVQHLEAQVQFCKEELLGIKQRVKVVVLENENLRDELKRESVQESLSDHAENYVLDAVQLPRSQSNELPKRVAEEKTSNTKQSPSHTAASSVATAIQQEQWKLELERLKALHEARTQTMEAQMNSLRMDLSESQRKCEEFRLKLRQQEGPGGGVPGGLCVKCAQYKAVLAHTHSDAHVQTIGRLTKERDELMDTLAGLRCTVSELQRREAAACEQVKATLETAEEANLEKAKMAVECEQIRSELSRQKERLGKELSLLQERIVLARNTAHNEAGKEKKALDSTVKFLSEKVGTLEAQLERLTREKGVIGDQLEEAQKQLTAHETDLSKMCGEMRFQLNQAKLRKDEAEKELKEYRMKAMRQMDVKEQEVERLEMELAELRRRLERAEGEAARAGDERIQLTHRLGTAEQQFQIARMEKESLQRRIADDSRSLRTQAEQREQELIAHIQLSESQHRERVSELEALSSSQNALLKQLKDECKLLSGKLSGMNEKYRAEVAQLSQENGELRERLARTRQRADDLESQCVQHGRIHERMKERLQQLDVHSQASARQVVELLGKQGALLHERQLLSHETHFLKTQAVGHRLDRAKPFLPGKARDHTNVPSVAASSECTAYGRHLHPFSSEIRRVHATIIINFP
ncbi:serologically defined colon cancer antigen 8 isoform X2 [Petromyzon marinus]|uniref:Serologically defined colon cancer antigen 8 isoform X2 n=1 Tax=Petromyzon marinus TaxID=7757 RepID=A0AAJ7SRW5_PETMA|nr:serologically defined colon cancer antigen 8 isoform X2 [Petromyzon marinus]